MRSLTLLTLAAALALAPFAAGQAPPLPAPGTTYIVTVTAPAELTGLEANASVQVPFTVTLEVSNVLCTTDVTIPVALAASAAGNPANIAFTIEPAVVNITIPQGPHPAPAGGSMEAMLIGTVTGNITTNGTATITITPTAPAPAGPPQGCQGAPSIPSATVTPGVVNASFTATPQPPPPEPPAEDTPFVGVFAVLVVVGALAAAKRRKA